MTISICGNCISFGDCNLCSVTGGFDFGGVLCAAGFFDDRTVLGASFGYSMTGSTTGAVCNDVIQRFPFASNTPSTDVGETAEPTVWATGHSSSDAGFRSGGCLGPPNIFARCTREKFPFASHVSSVVTVGVDRFQCASGSMSLEHGYIAGGIFKNPNVNQGTLNCIQKFPFAAHETNITFPSSLGGSCTKGSGGASSSVAGYNISGPNPVNASCNCKIIRYPFAGDTSVTAGCVGVPLVIGAHTHESDTHAYYSGICLYTGPPAPGANQGYFNKFSFASETTQTCVGDTAVSPGTVSGGASTSSCTSGVSLGGQIYCQPVPAPPTVPATDQISCFPFSSDVNQSDIAELGSATYFSAEARV